MQFDTPLLFMIFNRPDTTAVVFEEIKKLKPARLFVAGDGPRAHKPGEAEKCMEARKIATNVDWPCEVKTLFREANLGCQKGPSSAITWFFDQVPEGIILEDDCVPDPSFFRFCTELLEKYRDDDKVMQISGLNVMKTNPHFVCNESYYFSIFPHLWGWASWRRAWKHYDIEMKKWPEARDKKTVKKILGNPALYEYWENLWNTYYNGVRDSWDRPWAFDCMIREGLSINPAINLISNIGFGEEATHTKNTKSSASKMEISTLEFPLIHPKKIEADKAADNFSFKYLFGTNATWQQRVLGPLRRTFPKTYRKIKNLAEKK